MATQAADTGRGWGTLHGRIVPIGAGLLIAALLTDYLYVRTVQTQWETFSVWLITWGLVVAAVSGLALLVDLALKRGRVSPPRFLLFTAAALLSIFNAFVHSRDSYTAVAPTGIALSAVVAVLLILGGIAGWEVTRPAVAEER